MPRSTIILRSYARRQRDRGFQLLPVLRLRDAHRRAEIGRLDEHGKRQAAHTSAASIGHAGTTRIPPPAARAPWQTRFIISLSIDDRRRQHARAHVRQIGQLQQALHRAVFAEGAVQHREDHVDVRIARPARAGSAAGSTCPSLPMKYSALSYFARIHGRP